jgi:photosystem II stability/assembly factor-like uncharacterized protein
MKKNLLLCLAFCSPLVLWAQRNAKKTSTSPPSTIGINQSSVQKVNDSLFNGLKWRNVGPFRAGRSLAVAGHHLTPMVYYFGAVGGGVWKTVNGGSTWFAVSDSAFNSSSVGALAVAPSDPNVVYAGMGEADMRSNISFGDGMYRSTDAGKTWKHLGLKKADAIANIEVHPSDPNTVLVAAVGNPFAPNPERGVFKTTDGGQTWKHVLAKNDSTGAAMVRIDPNNPRIVYATMWQAYRNGFSMSSGGKHCGLYKSVDGGDTWKDISTNPGLPKGILGKIGIAIAASNSNRLYALVENAKGGLYTSADGGETWSLVNEDKNLWQRCWYYMDLEVNPQNELDVIVLNVNALRTKDGGKTFRRLDIRHGDTHDAWINPKNPDNFIIGDDGGAEVTFDGGLSFSDIDIPTAQFYHVSLDNDFPYNIYGAQQDNSSVRIASRSKESSITKADWYPVAGGEAGYIAADPTNSMITYGGEYDGQMSEYNATTNETRDVSIWPESSIGAPSSTKKYRFQWTYPIVFSPHNPNELYITSNHVHRSTNRGLSWETLSPDLSRNDPKTLGETGGPITKDMTGAEIYGTIFTFAESPVEKSVFWTGSDDGLVHISQNGGKDWQNISLPESSLPSYSLISLISPSEFDKGKAYLAANKYMFGDRNPYLFKTTDYGKTWTKIVKGIPADEYCRVVREDPNKKGLLYAGTERGIYVSFDDGQNWQSLKLNLPLTPVRDLQIQKREKDLVIATHGRSFWVLDDLGPIYEIADNKTLSTHHLFKPRPTYLMTGGQRPLKPDADQGLNLHIGSEIRYYLKKPVKNELRLQFISAKGDTINTFSNLKDKKGEAVKVSKDFYEDTKQVKAGTISNKAGMNTFVWNLTHKDVTEVEGTNVMWAGSTAGARIPPGNVTVRLLDGKEVIGTQTLEVKIAPFIKASQGDLEEQYNLIQKVNKKVDEIHKTINQIKTTRTALQNVLGSQKDTTIFVEARKLSKSLNDSLDLLENKLMQTKAKAPQDVLAFPIRLNDKMAGVASYVSYNYFGKPNKQQYDVYDHLEKQVNEVLKRFAALKTNQIKQINDKIAEEKKPAIILKD